MTERPPSHWRTLVRRGQHVHVPSFSMRTVVVIFVLVLGIIIGSMLTIATYVGKVNQLGHQNKSALATLAQVQQAGRSERLAEQQKLAQEQAEADAHIRAIICTFISLAPRARAKLLPLLPSEYAKTQCQAVPTASKSSVTPRATPPGPSPTPGGDDALGVPTPTPSTGVRIVTTSARPSSTPTAWPSTKAPTPESSSSPIIDLPVLLCSVEALLGLCSTP